MAGRGIEQGYLLRREGQSSSVNTVAIGEGDAVLGRNACGHDSQGVSVFSDPRGCLPNPKIGLALFKCANGNLPNPDRSSDDDERHGADVDANGRVWWGLVLNRDDARGLGLAPYPTGVLA